jgi:two-component system sensor histidine kinase/response regulator
LLVNDELFLLQGYKGVLESKFIVHTAENGLQALQKIHVNPIDYFDAIILDINMPIMDGYEACTLIYDFLN